MRDLKDYEERTREKVKAMAKDRGCEAVFADSRTLQIDLDSQSLERFEELFHIAKRRSLIPQRARAEAWTSRRGNWHVQIHLPKSLPFERRILLQALLGSDEKREILNLTEERAETVALFKPIYPLSGAHVPEAPHLAALAPLHDYGGDDA